MTKLLKKGPCKFELITDDMRIAKKAVLLGCSQPPKDGVDRKAIGKSPFGSPKKHSTERNLLQKGALSKERLFFFSFFRNKNMGLPSSRFSSFFISFYILALKSNIRKRTKTLFVPGFVLSKMLIIPYTYILFRHNIQYISI